MKRRLFGLGAALVVCASLTSCYDQDGSEIITPDCNGAPAYVMAGSVTDAESFQGIEGATVSYAGKVVATTNAKGKYETKQAEAPFKGAVDFAATGYKGVTLNANQAAVASGVTTLANFDAELTILGHHDNHGGHDNNDSHGGNPAAGGGSGEAGSGN